MRVGRAFRAIRLRLGWRQRDVAVKAGVSQQEVSDIECGHLERVSLRQTRRVGQALGIVLALAPRWRGSQVDRLLDAQHAAITGMVVGILRSHGWEVLVEWSFAYYGERGSVDIVAWHDDRQALLVCEIKSELVDMQDLLSSHDRKVRLAPILLKRERGWAATAIGRVVVLSSSSANHDAVARNAAVFEAVLPARTRTVRRWLADPATNLAGICFVRATAQGGTTNRLRRARARLAPSSGKAGAGAPNETP